MFLQQTIPATDPAHEMLRLIAFLATLLKVIPNTYFLVSMVGTWVPPSLMSMILSFLHLGGDAAPMVGNHLQWIFPNGTGQSIQDALTLQGWPWNFIVIVFAMIAQLPGDIQMIV